MAHLLHPLLRPLVEALRPHRRRGHRPVLRARVRRLRGPRGGSRRGRRGRRGLRVGGGHRTGLVHLKVNKFSLSTEFRVAQQDFTLENQTVTYVLLAMSQFVLLVGHLSISIQ